VSQEPARTPRRPERALPPVSAPSKGLETVRKGLETVRAEPQTVPRAILAALENEHLSGKVLVRRLHVERGFVYAALRTLETAGLIVRTQRTGRGCRWTLVAAPSAALRPQTLREAPPPARKRDSGQLPAGPGLHALAAVSAAQVAALARLLAGEGLGRPRALRHRTSARRELWEAEDREESEGGDEGGAAGATGPGAGGGRRVHRGASLGSCARPRGGAARDRGREEGRVTTGEQLGLGRCLEVAGLGALHPAGRVEGRR